MRRCEETDHTVYCGDRSKMVVKSNSCVLGDVLLHVLCRAVVPARSWMQRKGTNYLMGLLYKNNAHRSLNGQTSLQQIQLTKENAWALLHMCPLQVLQLNVRRYAYAMAPIRLTLIQEGYMHMPTWVQLVTLCMRVASRYAGRHLTRWGVGHSSGPTSRNFELPRYSVAQRRVNKSFREKFSETQTFCSKKKEFHKHLNLQRLYASF